MSSSSLYLQDPDWGKGFWRLAAVVGFHVLVLACLLYYKGVQPLPDASSIITVSLMNPPAPAPEVVPPQPEPPKPVVKKVEQRKILVADTPAPSTFTAPPPDPAPTPPAPSAPSAPIAADPVVDPNFTASYLNNPAATYPMASRRAKEQGTVYVRALVNTQGLPEKIELSKSSGFDRLDNAALEVVKRYKFIPARQGPLIVSAWVTIPMKFSLTD